MSLKSKCLLFLSALILSACSSLTYPQKVTRDIEFLVMTDQILATYEIPSSDHAAMIQPLRQYAQLYVESVEFDPTLHARTHLFGLTERVGTKWTRMVIDSAQTPDTQVATLLHEIAHVKHGYLITGPTVEVIAEAVAYAAGTKLGIDTYRQSLSYLSNFPVEPREEVLRVFECSIEKWANELVNAANGGYQ